MAFELTTLGCSLVGALALALPGLVLAQEPIATRPTLGGDWGGMRSGLAGHGVKFDFWVTGFGQGLLSGAGYDDFDSDYRADLKIDADTGSLGLWSGGGLHAHLTYRGAEMTAFRGGALWPVYTSGILPIGSPDELVATSLYLSQRLGVSTRLMVGKINAVDLLASHAFFGGWGTDRFWNITFVAPPSGVVPPVFIGAVLAHSFAPFSLTLMVFDPGDRTTQYSFRDLFSDGVNMSLGLSWSGEVAQRKSSLGVTGTYSTTEGTDFTQIGLPPGSATTSKRGMYNIAIEGSHLLREGSQKPGSGLGLYGKAAIADGNPNPIRASFAGGVAGTGIVPGRPLDSFGVGYFYYNFSNQLQDAVSPIGSFNDEQGLEAYYSFAATPWALLSVDLQWIKPATGANPSAWVGGLRARFQL
jgi:porin